MRRGDTRRLCLSRTNLPTSAIYLLQGEQVTWQRRKRRSANLVTRPERRSQPLRGSVGASGGRNRRHRRHNPNHSRPSASGDRVSPVPAIVLYLLCTLESPLRRNRASLSPKDRGTADHREAAITWSLGSGETPVPEHSKIWTPIKPPRLTRYSSSEKIIS